VPVEDVRLLSDLRLRQPVLLFAFTGWNDAGEGASGAIRVLAEHWDATHIAEFDAEPFTDFATVRPFVVIDEGHRQIVWPTVDVWAASLPSTDVLLVIGPEPALQWRRFCEEVVSLAEHYDVSMAIGLGALLAEYPHRRPAHLTATSTDEALRTRFGLRSPSYEGPTGIVGVLCDAISAGGTPTASLWAAVPTYTAQLAAAKATAALVRAVCTMIRAAVPVTALASAIADYESRVADLLEDDKLAAYVSRLEEAMPTHVDDDDAGDELSGELDADGDSRLVAEVEEFLRESGDP
jgi:predicted ATP-grasp superfamily ATP-dependent carboligase